MRTLLFVGLMFPGGFDTFKSQHPFLELGGTLTTELLHRPQRMIVRFFHVYFVLAIELISIADYLFLKRLWKEVECGEM